MGGFLVFLFTINLKGCLLSQKDVPAGLSRRDTQILQDVRRKAHKLDKEFTIFGFSFGWGFIISEQPLSDRRCHLTVSAVP
jgi:hypothetical protein